MDTKRLKVPVQLRVNMWLGLSAYEKKFNSFSEGTFSVFAEMVYRHLRSWQNSALQSASHTKHFSFHCFTVWESSPGFWEVGDYRTSGAPQILRRDRQTETEARVLHPSEGMGVGEWLVYWPRESVSMLWQRYMWCLLHFTAHCSIILCSAEQVGYVCPLLFAFLSYPTWFKKRKSDCVNNLEFTLLNHTASLHNSESEPTRITFQHNLIFSTFLGFSSTHCCICLVRYVIWDCSSMFKG